MSAEDDEDAAEYASELLVGLVAEHLGGQDVDACSPRACCCGEN